MALCVQAGLWGLLAGGALVVGALIAWFVRVRSGRCRSLPPGWRRDESSTASEPVPDRLVG
jgi:hypothetical protein